jgi:hypothetical protein
LLFSDSILSSIIGWKSIIGCMRFNRRGAVKILFFSPFSGVLPFIRAQVQLAEGLKKIGHEVSMINCDGIYKEFCVTMSAHGLTENSDISLKQAQCRACKRLRDSNNSRFHYSTEWVDSGIRNGDEIEIDLLLQSVTPLNWMDFCNDGFPVGRIASYEFLINYKKNSFDLSLAEFVAYKIALRNTLVTQRAMQRILKRIQPNHVLIFDTGYSVNAMVKALADQMGIGVYNISFGQNLSDSLARLTVARESSIASILYLKSTIWQQVKNTPIGAAQADYVIDHFRALFQATNAFVYSSPRSGSKLDVRSHFGISPAQKIIVASLSSYDERFANNVIGRASNGTGALFPSQASWCESLIAWIQNRPEYFLIIRVHPREFPNKREGVMSVHVEKLRAVFANLPKNVAINWPTENLSIYDIAEEADVFLNAWSSVGVEMSMLGLPVVIYSEELPYYPEDINLIGKSLSDYFAKVEEALRHGWDFEKMRMAFRWLSTAFAMPVVELPLNRQGGNTFIQRGLRFLGRKFFGARILIERANKKYVDQSCLNESAIRQVEDLLLNRRQSLADVQKKAGKKLTAPEEEAEYIRIQMESLFRGTPSRIISSIRAHFSKAQA